MRFLKYIYIVFLLSRCLNLNASTYFVSNSLGNDTNSGLSSQTPIKSISRLNTFNFFPGDSILFKSGDTFLGMFWLKGSGDSSHPIVVDTYGGLDKASINGDGYQSCILLFNNEFISINNLDIFNENSHLDSLGNIKLLAGFSGASNTWGSGKNVRFGIKIVATSKSLTGFSFNNLKIHDIYPSPVLSQNIHKGYGIKIESQSDTLSFLYNRISDLKIYNCDISKTGHYGIWVKSLGLNGIDSVKNSNINILECNFEDTGGSGFVPNKSKNILVQNSSFNHSGSSIDPRMWKRGSGLWTFDCKDVIVQHNYFMNAHGPQDSYGAHIDYGNENVVFQYNYSYNNEGGFAEILGDNINCGYRYNISVNDGYRLDPNNSSWDKKGKIFWISNFCGSGPRCPNVGSFIYNNTIFVNDSLNPEIYFWPNIGDVHLYNNLIYVGSYGNKIPTLLQNTSNILNISHNIFYDSSRLDLDSDLMNNAIFENPQLVNSFNQGVNNPLFYKIQNSSIAIGNGKLISGSNDSTNYLNNNGGKDYFGNLVSNSLLPNIGAYNGESPSGYNTLKEQLIYAYPTATIDYLQLKSKSSKGPFETYIYDLNGKYISNQIGDKISLINFKKGIYLLKVNYGDKVEELRVIKL
ncbi:MAG: right-handed parallel beta-helix repeat-containing protein [Flavobacteriales bacterium]